MLEVSDEQFGEFVEAGISAVPDLYRTKIQNVAFIVEDYPTQEQRIKLNLYPNETLFGLYEGVPLPKRNGTLKVLPDKITIFKMPLLAASPNLGELKKNIGHTIWHEVAHYFGLDHAMIHKLDNKRHQK